MKLVATVSAFVTVGFCRWGKPTTGFFDGALRTVKEYLETVEYIPMNPVRRGLVQRAEEWKGSIVRE